MNAPIGDAQIVTFLAKDLERERAFYVDTLGFPVEREAPEEYVMLALGRFRLCIDREDWEGAARGGGASLRFEVADLGRTAEELGKRGVRYARGGDRHGRYIEVGDPEGYRLTFSERL